MKGKQPPIYHSCLDLAGLVYAITWHFPRKAGYEEGDEMRKAVMELVKDCLLANRAQAGSEERLRRQGEMEDCIIKGHYEIFKARKQYDSKRSLR